MKRKFRVTHNYKNGNELHANKIEDFDTREEAEKYLKGMVENRSVYLPGHHDWISIEEVWVKP